MEMPMPREHIEGQRVVLAPYDEAAHRPRLLDAFRHDRRAFRDMMMDTFEDYAAVIGRSDGALAITRRGSGEPVGVFWFADYSARHSKVDFSALIRSRYWGTRANAEAHALVFRFLRKQAGIQRLQFTIRPDNAYSRRNAEQLGAIYEGTLRANFVGSDGTAQDELCYTIARDEEWEELLAKMLLVIAG